jgi:hypothetical protein
MAAAGRDRARADLPCRQPGPLDRGEQAAADDEPVGASQPAEQRHHALGLPQRQPGLEHEPCMPAGGGDLEALVLPVGQLEQKQQRVGIHHERMFARAFVPVASARTVRGRLTGFSWLYPLGLKCLPYRL